jgi:N-acetylmuramoyl-L-alanine amidase
MTQVDYPGALDFIITDPAWVFTDALASLPNSDLSIVNHKTACGVFCTATDVAENFIHDTTNHKSAHFVVGRDGSFLQVVLLKDGAGANCCLEMGHGVYWDRLQAIYGNLNRCTIGIEHEDWTSDNSQPMTQAQIDASNKLNFWLAERYNLPTAQIHSHASLDPISRAQCPGPTFDFTQLFTYIDNGRKQSLNPNQIKQATDIWNANSVGAGVGTGIFNAYLQAYLHLNCGTPTTKEIATVDWNGNAIAIQYFSGGIHTEWDGKAHFYDHTNKLLLTI